MADFTIRVGSFNLRHANMNDPAPNNWASRLPIAANHVRASGAVLIGLQECSYLGEVDSQAQQLVNAVNIATGGNWQLTWPAELGTMAIMYDASVLTLGRAVTRIRVNTINTLGGNRYMLSTTFRHRDGGSFVFANTHWHHDDPTVANGVLRRAESAGIVLSQLDSLRTSTGLPTVLTGDFNTGDLSTGSPRQRLVAGGYRSVASVVTPVNGAYNSYNAFNLNMTGRVEGIWIDGVHVSSDVTVGVTGQVLTFANGSSLPLSSPLPSDHNLVYTTLTIPFTPPAVNPVTSTAEPSSAWPRRNLGPAEHWGRTVESRIKGVTDGLQKSSGSLAGTNRHTASSTEQMTRNAQALQDVTEDIANSIQQYPQYFTAGSNATGFSYDTGWTTLCSLTVPRPVGFTQLEMVAQGNAFVDVSGGGGTSYNFIWPFSLSIVSSEFGPRPPLPFHNGIDFAAGTGTYIPAAADGTIMLVGYYDDWGNYLRIRHPNIDGATIWTGYAHMQSYPAWSVGDSIEQSDMVGRVGSTGFVTGPHLHYETAVNGERINPRTFMSIYGTGTVVVPAVTRSRIIIGGVASAPFEPFLQGTVYQSHAALDGASLTTSGNVTVQFQINSTANIPASSINTALLTVTGGFSR